MRKSRFLWIRDIPPKCCDADLRNIFERHGSVQKIRMFKEGHIRHAVVAFTDIKSASAAISEETKLNDTPLKLEYCVSSDLPGIINHKTCNSSDSHSLPTNSIQKSEKELVMKNASSKNLNDPHHHHHQQQQRQQNSFSNSSNDGQQQLGRGPLIFKRTNSSNLSSAHLLNQVLRTVQNSTLNSRVQNTGLRGLKIGDLPSPTELSDTTLRKNLFSEFRRCGHIQSVVLPSINGTNGGKNSGRLAIITFRQPEEAERAYQAIQRGGKALFSTNISVELHPGIDINDDLTTKRPPASNDLVPHATVRSATSLQSLNNTAAPTLSNKSLSSNSVEATVNRPALTNKSPTRTLHVAGLTVEPTGPVTAEQLTTAFRKFGDIISVQLRPSSNSALIQFAEVRGPIRAMSVHARDPLRLGGRPLTLAYTPSPPASSLWISDLPPSLANMKDEELLHSLSRIVPIQEIVLINRTDPTARNQSTANSPHYAAYIRLNSDNHAARLLSELRSGKYLTMSSSGSIAISSESGRSSPTQTAPRRRLVAVDFASIKQSSFVTSLQMNASKSTLSSQRIRVISASSVDQWKHATNQPPIASSATTTLTSIPSVTDQNRCRTLPNCGESSDRFSEMPSKSSNPGLNRSKSNNPTSSISISSSIMSSSFRETENKTDNLNTNTNNISNKDHSRLAKSTHRKSSRQKTHSSTTAASIGSTSHQYLHLSNHDKRMRDSSPSSLSVSSVSSSGSSVSSDSSTSSSVSSGTISSSSSMSSLSSSSASSNRNSSLPRKVKSSSNQKNQPKSNESKREQLNDLFKRSPSTSSNNVHKSSRKSVTSLDKSDSIRKQDSNPSPTAKPLKNHLSEGSHSLWSHNSPSESPSVQQPLRVVTTIAPTVYSPNRNPVASSGELSSPGSCSSTLVTELSNVVKTPNRSDSALIECPKSINHSTSKLISKVQQSTTGMTTDSFRASPTSRSCSVSASSGISSGGPSFGSTNSSGGGSAGSSPFNGGANSTASYGQLLSVTKPNYIPSQEQNKLVPSSPSSNKQQLQQQLSRTQKSRSSIESPSHLKLHLPSNQALASSSPGCNGPVYTTSTTPLTVSIRLTSAGRQSQSNSTTSPCSLSANNEIFGPVQEKQNGDSLPLTPVSAPPLGCPLSRRSRSSSKESRRRSIGIEAPVSRNDTQNTDWWTHGTPVYESMYDKIKRRTNKEAEERRQRQLEALAAREKKRRKQKKKDQIAKSPSASGAPFTPPDSFGSEHSGKTAATYSSSKSRHPTAVRQKTDQSPAKRDINRSLSSSKGDITSSTLMDSSHDNRWSSIQRLTDRNWSNRLEKEPNELTQHSRHSSDNLHLKSKRRRSTVSSLSSSLSSEGEFNSNSPPGTFTRLSLGMRFAVSATYHECIRPNKSTPSRKWSNASEVEDDDALSQLSSSLSCSSNENKIDKHHTSRSNTAKSIRPISAAKNASYRLPIRSSLESPNLSRTSIQSNRKRHSDLSNSYEFSNSDHSWVGDHRASETNKSINCFDSYKKVHASKKSRTHTEVKPPKNSKSSLNMDQHSQTKIEVGVKRQQEQQNITSRKLTNGQPTKKRRLLLKSDERSKSPESHPSHHHSRHSPSKSGFHHRFHSPKPYFSDDGTLLDSEAEDIKDSFASDSVSHSSGRNSLKNYLSASRHLSPTRSETGESNLSDMDHQPHSPNPVPHASLKIRTSKIGSSNLLCSIPSTGGDDGDSVFEAFVDSDRFSANSKSTASTEPMEQCDLNDHSPCLKSSDEDEWHSGVASSSPHPAHLEFDDDDDDDYGECDTKTNHHAVMSYQSNNSLLGRMTSPICKLPSPTADYLDEAVPAPITDITTSESSVKTNHFVKTSPEQHHLPSPTISKQTSDSCSLMDSVKSQLPNHDPVAVTIPLVVACESKPSLSQSPTNSKDHIKTESVSPVPVVDNKQPLCPTTPVVTSAVLDVNSSPQVEPAKCKTQSLIVESADNITSDLETKINMATKSDISTLDTRCEVARDTHHLSEVLPATIPVKPILAVSQSAVPTITNITPTIAMKIYDSEISEATARLSPVSSVSISCSPKSESSILSLNQLTSTIVNTSTSHVSPTYVHAQTVPNISSSHINQSSETKTKTVESNIDKYVNPTILPASSTPRASVVATSKSAVGIAQSSGPSNNGNSIAGGSLTEAHDITRYVQSVIERVKAERVEETQLAAAHCHQHSGHHSSASSVPNSTTNCHSTFASHLNKTSNELLSIPSSGKRSSNNQRRSLLVTTSTCSSTKSSTTRSSKWLNSLSSISNPSVVSCNSEWTDPSVQFSTTLTTGSGTIFPTTQASVSSDLPMPSIPGVNACAPLISPTPQLNATHRITRQSSNSNAINRRTDSTGENQTVSTTITPASGRRSRRSESKSTNAPVCTRDNTPISITTAAVTSTPVTTTTFATTSIITTPIVTTSTPITRRASGSIEEIVAPIQTTRCDSPSKLCPNSHDTPKPRHDANRTTVDPYEPNFDEESPPGFDPGQLHHHRSTPPICPSPGVHQSRKTQYVTPTTTSISEVSSPLSVSTITTTTTTVVLPFTSSNIDTSSSQPIHTLSTPFSLPVVTSAITTNVCSSNSSVQEVRSVDTVDEVIRDVCAGQFDVQSYLNSMRANTAIPNTVVTNAPPKPPAVISSDPVPTQTSIPATTTLPAASTKPATVSTNPPTLTFPLPISSEPLVAAVTIPVNSGSTVTKLGTLGKNGSNNIVNIGTGNALLNTLVAALQLIPGSQVTVTGPAAAAGVVGGIAGAGAGTISATTITLPVGAAHIAAENIKAAVLSAKNASAVANMNMNASNPAITQSTTHSIPDGRKSGDPNPVTKLPNELEHGVKTMRTTSTVTTSLSTAAPVQNSVAPSASIRTTLTNPVNPSVLNVPTVSISSTQATTYQSHIVSESITLPTQIQTKTICSISNGHPIAASVPVPNSSLFQLQKVALEAPLNRSVVSLPNSQANFEHSTIAGSTPNVPTKFLTPSSSPHIQAPHVPAVQQHMLCNLKQPFGPHHSPVLSNSPQQQIQQQNSQTSQPQTRTIPSTMQSPAPPVVPGRSPPLSTQNIIERLTSGVEPSVAMALAQAAMSGSGLSRVLSENASAIGNDAQVLAYFRRLAQFLDARGCNGPNKLAVPLTCPPPPPDSQNHSNVYISSLSPSPTPTGPINSSPHRPPAPGVSFTSPVAVNTADLEVDSNISNGALISPPVGTPRQPVVEQNIPLNGGSGATSSTQSWNNLGAAYPLVWQGRLSLKNIETRVALHYVHGNANLLHACMTLLASGGGGQSQFSLVTNGGPLRIVQRMRLEPAQLEGVQRKINQEGASCACLALPTGNNPVELLQQTHILNDNFIRYMQEKMAAGIINVGHPEYQQGLYVVHIFPPCEFSHAQLNLAAPDLHRRVVQSNQSHLLVVITTV